MSSTLKVLKAGLGDCLLIRFLGDDNKFHNILIDGGNVVTIKLLQKEVELIRERNEKLDLVILTHIDDDHINGLVKLFAKDKNTDLVKEVWFNSSKSIAEYFNQQPDASREVKMLDSPENADPSLSAEKGYTFEKRLEGLKNVDWKRVVIAQKEPVNLCGAKLYILSPTAQGLQALHLQWPPKEGGELAGGGCEHDYEKSINELYQAEFREDNSPTNGSSIAIALMIQEKVYLLLADSFPSVICNSLRQLEIVKDGEIVKVDENNKLKVDYCKVSHHGSRANTTPELLNLLECENFVISTNGKSHCFPHKESIVKIIKNADRSKDSFINIYVNHEPLKPIFSMEEINEYKINLVFPESSFGFEF